MGRRLRREDVEQLAEMIDGLAETLGCSPEEAMGYVSQICQQLPLGEDDFIAIVRNAQRVRLRRNALLNVDLFRDPAWDMLIELLLSQREGRTVSVSTLCFASGVPSTTALRHVEWMEAAGLVTRRGDSGDHRRVLVELAPGVEDRLERSLRELYVDGVVAARTAGKLPPDEEDVTPAG